METSSGEKNARTRGGVGHVSFEDKRLEHRRPIKQKDSETEEPAAKVSPPFHASILPPQLFTNIIGNSHIEVHDEVTSTNDIAIARGKVGSTEEGILIIAEHQTAGRGRYGRTWEAPPGKCILASVVLRHRLKQDQVHLPNLIGALSIAVGIHATTGLEARIKHPNDVRIAKRKVAGVLTELEYDQHQQPFFVIGFGVNVNITPAELPPSLQETATSLRIAASENGIVGQVERSEPRQRDEDICRATLLQAILQQFEENYLHLKAGNISAIANQLKAWEEKP